MSRSIPQKLFNAKNEEIISKIAENPRIIKEDLSKLYDKPISSLEEAYFHAGVLLAYNIAFFAVQLSGEEDTEEDNYPFSENNINHNQFVNLISTSVKSLNDPAKTIKMLWQRILITLIGYNSVHQFKWDKNPDDYRFFCCKQEDCIISDKFNFTLYMKELLALLSDSTNEKDLIALITPFIPESLACVQVCWDSIESIVRGIHNKPLSKGANIQNIKQFR